MTGYRVYRNGSAAGTTASTSHTVSGLTCGTAYTFAVEAHDAAGNTSSRASLTASTTACATADTTPPSAPGTPTKTGATGTSVSLSWSASTDNVAVTGYRVYRNGSAAGTTASTSHTVAGLTCGTAYAFAVEAHDAAGNTSSRASLTASTAACPTADTAAPSVPQNMAFTGTPTRPSG